MAVPLLAVGLLLSYMATPGWIELSCMFPNRVGGIAATCAEAFRPYSAVLANLTGVCYWWGWVPTCGLTAIFSAEAIHQWYLPHVPGQAHGDAHRAGVHRRQPVRAAVGRPGGQADRAGRLRCSPCARASSR